LLRGVPWVGSPTSSLVLRHSDSPAPPLRSALALLGGSTFQRLFRARSPPLRPDPAAFQGSRLHELAATKFTCWVKILSGLYRAGSASDRRTNARSPMLTRAKSTFSGGVRASQVPGGPSHACPALRPRWDRGDGPVGHRPVGRLGIAFRDFDGVGSHDKLTFEAQSHGLHARCLRFAAGVAHVDARLASGWWPSLAGRDSNPLGPHREVSACSTWHPPRPGFAWRTEIHAKLTLEPVRMSWG
jgi:hypothetical protein